MSSDDDKKNGAAVLALGIPGAGKDARGRFERELDAARKLNEAAIAGRPQRVAFRPGRVKIPPVEMPATWVINDIRIGNHAQIPRGWRRVRVWLGRVWRKLTWFWPRKPPVIRLISGDKTPPASGTMPFYVDGDDDKPPRAA